ncbi:Carbohydrate binding module (family 6) [Ruminococcus sp. YE71]|uniref:carbohydrate-binding protein n=1 Tax=unclassified Ruminococcus TaxID=2608920 RepID=UPI00088FB37A|nr:MULTISPECIES: carbohydrate-binding protein [unclassified Ruminococcus]SDA24736.1 Carbohydrate binding module (family 6) [Ruminococcus sp. YE78]SFW43602.1 Carbohydrate binding module (family 6) [Ruminococcus sp. YE71]
MHNAEEVYLTDCEFAKKENDIYVKCKNENVIAVKGVDFGDKCRGFAAKVRGSGTLEVRLDKPDGEVLSALKFDADDRAVYYNDAETDGRHDLFFVFDGEFGFDEWQFAGK